MVWWKHMPGRKPEIVLHHFGVDDLALRELQPLIERLTAELALDVRLGLHGGDAVVVDASLMRTVSPQLLQAFCEERPVLTLKRGPAGAGQVRGSIVYEALRDAVQALCVSAAAANGMEAAVAAAVAPQGLRDVHDSDSGYDSSFDSRYPGHMLMEVPADEGSMHFLRELHLGKADPRQPPLVAEYGAGATMLIDFANACVMLEPAAWSELRLARRLPQRVAEAMPVSVMQARELDLVLWDLGWAAGAHPLLGAPADWWHAPLLPLALEDVARYSSAPLHREMARVLLRGGVTPSQLRRECRAGLRELRCFLQACTFLHLLAWDTQTDQAAHITGSESPSAA